MSSITRIPVPKLEGVQCAVQPFVFTFEKHSQSAQVVKALITKGVVRSAVFPSAAAAETHFMQENIFGALTFLFSDDHLTRNRRFCRVMYGDDERKGLFQYWQPPMMGYRIHSHWPLSPSRLQVVCNQVRHDMNVFMKNFHDGQIVWASAPKKNTGKTTNGIASPISRSERRYYFNEGPGICC